MSDLYSSNYSQQPQPVQKDFTTAIILSVLLGALGVDRFYLGYTGLGIVKLAVALLSFGTIAWIWWIVDIILIATGKLTDSRGIPLRRA
jgi:TM2 domain-containing membrane protein YozV